MPGEEAYDYIVVGAGSAGSIVAARLSEGGRHSVLLLEAGGTDKRFWVQVPLGYGRIWHDERVNWKYWSEPVPGLGNRPDYYPRGKLLGGSGSINAMVYMRGQREDYEAWRALGNPGWGWDEVLAAYRRLEDHHLGASALHGSGGPLHIASTRDAAHPTAGVFLEAGRELGYPVLDDVNGPTREGVAYIQLTTRGGMRHSASRAFLWPASRRANLRIVTRAHATRLLFDGARATGVEYRRDGSLRRATARAEVIVAGGAINTPQLLQLSGIGPGALLQLHGIQVRRDLPVGLNLQDHLGYDHMYRATRPTLNDVLYPLLGKLRVGLQYLLTRGGPLSIGSSHAGGFVRSEPGPRDGTPNMQLYFAPISFERMVPGKRKVTQADPFPGICISVSPCRPTSRGTVEIRSPDPFAAPAIQPNTLGTAEDMAELVGGARFLRRLAATKALSALIERESAPGPDVQSDEALAEDIRRRCYSIFHPCGTARMGPHPRDAVVDARLRVHGVEGLRVIDASVFPLITSGNLNAPSMMVGLRGAELVLEDAR
ncbi:MAG: GMC family oxidoreductase N-terminal domain-containing protein [Rhodospirillales bacterium]|nr:GMC family oxidoreductase N-terminal domain-containing protein [Rhodospirillales bacterium]